MASIDLERMLDKVKNSQWTLSDIDWDAPGRELVTAEQWPKLKDFMADLMWIEHEEPVHFPQCQKKHRLKHSVKCMPFSMLKNSVMPMLKWH
ncbi:hypothetical protein [Acinetobacter chinensis]|uniref:hypothetical protein n=1 Tax=Acinetobacter chinensis TaxID=2004650 RepID=UPI00222874CA|nr:hypothetical protein [Acinetobacter chinensis]